jgi:hypothetical protein
MLTAFWRWLRGLFGAVDDGVTPHPDMTSDQGERRHIDAQMEADSRHVGQDRHDERP